MSEFEEDLERAREAFREIMAPHNNDYGVVNFPSPHALREADVSRNARLFANRYQMVQSFPHAKIVAEIGVLRGDFSDFILKYCRPQQLHLFDIDFEAHCVEARFAREAEAGQVVFHRGDSAATVASQEDGFFDWIYIDAGHDYGHVAGDARASIPKLKTGGTLVFNDYIFWSHTESRPYGVVQAVNELVATGEWQVSAFALHPAMYCDIALTRR